MNGFFNQDALEMLQQAYEMQLTPEEQDIDELTGLPTNVVSNTSPWANDVELWKYPDGKNKLETSPILFTNQQTDEVDLEDDTEDGLAPEEEVYYDSEEEPEEEGSAEDEEISDEEIDALIQEILSIEEDTFVDEDDEQG